jgi:hypothetical protein
MSDVQWCAALPPTGWPSNEHGLAPLINMLRRPQSKNNPVRCACQKFGPQSWAAAQTGQNEI